jgi:chorismate mutase
MQVAVRGVRGAIQVEANEREAILAGTSELVTEVMSRNKLSTDEVISVIFSATADLDAEFPAVAARQLGFEEAPLLCCHEIPVPGSMPRVVRLMMHVETEQKRPEVRHVYLRGAAALRLDIAQ